MNQSDTPPDEMHPLYPEHPFLEDERLRAIFPQILVALESGACSADCSVEFFEMIPNEVRLVIRKLKRERDNALNMDLSKIIAAMETLADSERLEIMSNFCKQCGDNDPGCNCWNDE